MSIKIRKNVDGSLNPEVNGQTEENKRRKRARRIIKKIVKRKVTDGTYITERTVTTLKRDGSKSIVRELNRYDSQESYHSKDPNHSEITKEFRPGPVTKQITLKNVKSDMRDPYASFSAIKPNALNTTKHSLNSRNIRFDVDQ